MNSLVVMGVAGCGKSSVGRLVAQTLGRPLVEGDDFHSSANLAKMAAGVALTDDDRDAWLQALAERLAAAPQGVVLTCSALKRCYRDRLRAASPGLRLIYLRISRDVALQRVVARSGAHVFPPSLVDSQFAALEPPQGEPGVLEVDATQPLAQLGAEVSAWTRRAGA